MIIVTTILMTIFIIIIIIIIIIYINIWNVPFLSSSRQKTSKQAVFQKCQPCLDKFFNQGPQISKTWIYFLLEFAFIYFLNFKFKSILICY